MKRKILLAGLIAVCVIAAGIGGYEKYSSMAMSHAAAASVRAPTVSANAQPSAPAALPDFTGIVAQNGRAVVNISATSNVDEETYALEAPRLERNDPFYWFFRRFRVPVPHGAISEAGQRIRLYRESRRHHPDQCARGGRRLENHGQAHR